MEQETQELGMTQTQPQLAEASEAQPQAGRHRATRTKKGSKEKLRQLKPKRFYQKAWFWLLTLGVAGVGVAGNFVWEKYGERVVDSVNTGYQIASTITPDSLRSNKSTIIYDYQGKVLKELNTAANFSVTKDNVNPLLSKGFVATEDERFLQHHGVDGWALLRAVVGMAKGGHLQGGSTITQQLVKNKILANQEQTIERKISEMVISQEIEKDFSKEEILTSYLNTAYFGHGATGVAQAAKVYFNKDQADLTPREAAVIIGLTNNPSLYDPNVYMDNSNSKTAEILGKMLRNKVINQEQYDEAMSQETKLSMTTLVNEREYTDSYPVSYAVARSAEELAVAEGFKLQYKFATDEEYHAYHQAYNATIQEYVERIVNGGYKIYTSINPEVQAEVESAVQNHLAGYTEIDENSGKLNLQTSVTVLDNNSHNIVAMVGGRGTEGDYFNRAYQSYRQPGSTSKPIIAYAPAFENGLLPQHLIKDTQVPEIPSVGNATGRYSEQDTTVRRAVDYSLNTVALRASFDYTSIDKVTDKLALMRFSNLTPQDNNNIIAIGGFTYGATTLEMAGAYSSFVNKGVYYQPSNVDKVVSAYDDSTVYFQNQKVGTKVYTQEASYTMLDVLKTSGSGATVWDHKALAQNYPLHLQGGKTGTTDAWKDVYFVSVNAHYTTAVWVGNDNNTPLPEYAWPEAKKVSRIVNEYFLAGKEHIDFEKPSSVIKDGEYINFTSQEDLNQFTESISATNFEKIASEKNASLQKENSERLAREDYRVIFGLTLEEEQAIEQDFEDSLNKVDVSRFTDISQYEKYQEDIAKLQAKLTEVKHQAAKDKFQESLNELQTSVSLRYTELIQARNRARTANLQYRVEAIKREANNNRTSQISELQGQLENLKSRIELTNRSGGDTSSLIKQLDEVVSKLNTMGHPTGYFTVYTDGTSTVFIQGEAPELKESDS